jgi:hypothetical protein
MEKLSKEDEKRVMSALERTIQLTNGGAAPDDALSKVAEEEQFSPQIIQRMAEAYNVSKTLSHMKKASGPDKASSFPLADAASVVERLYPKKPVSPAEKAAAFGVPDAYSGPETGKYMDSNPAPKLPEKRAGLEYPRDENESAARAINARRELIRGEKRASSEHRICWFNLLDQLKTAGQYFRQVFHEPFASVQTKVAADHGLVGRHVMDLIYQLGNLKEAKDGGEEAANRFLYNDAKEPYKSISQAIKTAHDLVHAAEEAATARNRLEECETKIGFRVKHENPVCLLDGVLGNETRPFEDGQEKQAIDIPTVIGAGAAALGLSQPNSEGVRRKALGEVYDPIHEVTLKGIHAKAMLNDMLSNDPIISSYDPGEVMTAYNSLAKLSPNLVQQPAVIRGLLRRMLQQEGVLEPHEAQQLTSIDAALRETVPGISGPK